MADDPLGMLSRIDRIAGGKGCYRQKSAPGQLRPLSDWRVTGPMRGVALTRHAAVPVRNPFSPSFPASDDGTEQFVLLIRKGTQC